jgi:carbon storage regulator
MLVLSRKANERILIGEDVEIVVIDVRGKRVRFGIKAPEETRILRLELESQTDDEQGDNQRRCSDVEPNGKRDFDDLQLEGSH